LLTDDCRLTSDDYRWLPAAAQSPPISRTLLTRTCCIEAIDPD
jgi:hypothetical protein